MLHEPWFVGGMVHHRRVERTPEFDAFGPWVYEVREPAEVPPVFRSHQLDLASARLVLKVPRPIERRNALPTMHLYDALLIAGPDALEVLRRVGDGFDVRRVPYERLGGAQLGVSLLQGWLVLYDAAPDATAPLVSVPFNGVSSDVVERLVDLLLELALVADPAATAARDAALAAAAVPGPDDGEPPWALGDADTSLVVAYRQLARRRPGVVRLADHGRAVVPRRRPGPAGLRDRWWPATVHAAVVSVAPGCIELLHRRELVSSGSRPVWSVVRTTVLTSAISGFAIEPHQRLRGVVEARIGVGGCEVRLDLPEGAATVPALADAVAVAVA